jgi:hypothetical protein
VPEAGAPEMEFPPEVIRVGVEELRNWFPHVPEAQETSIVTPHVPEAQETSIVTNILARTLRCLRDRGDLLETVRKIG